MLADTHRRRLVEIAFDRYGYVTTSEAAEVGVPAVELRKIAARGGVEHIAYGLYRFDDVPRTGLDQYMEAVLRVGPESHLTGDAVVTMLDLTPLNPNRIRVGTSRRARPALPRFVEIVYERLDRADLTEYEGIPSATVAAALRACRGRVITARLVEAAKEAARRGLVTRRALAPLIAHLADSAA
ncbi:MAG: hypothetical protein WKF86_04335 [Acidimicrobiales bacterium]